MKLEIEFDLMLKEHIENFVNVFLSDSYLEPDSFINQEVLINKPIKIQTWFKNNSNEKNIMTILDFMNYLFEQQKIEGYLKTKNNVKMILIKINEWDYDNDESQFSVIKNNLFSVLYFSIQDDDINKYGNISMSVKHRTTIFHLIDDFFDEYRKIKVKKVLSEVF